MNDFDDLLNQTVAGPMSTHQIPVPEGTYLAVVHDVNVVKLDIKKGERAGTSIPKLNVVWSVTDEMLRQTLGRENILVTQGILLDVTPSGQIDTSEGKNIQLGRVRKGLKQNDDSAWSPGRLKGAGPAYITVKHRANEADPENPYIDVSRVAPLG